uniref:C2H2-type domain-containing protein n=1 Tax=Globodera rostochiensis TaxID=31243 RepID=A0A914HSW7_GLORO
MTAFDLNLHMGTHTGFTYDCKDCGKCFPCRKTLAEHNRSHRMILSGGGGSASPEPPKKAKTNGGMLTISQDRENSPDFGGPNGDSGNEKRRLRVAKRGEKSRRNATLVAVESTAASPPSALPLVSSASSSWPSLQRTRCCCPVSPLRCVAPMVGLLALPTPPKNIPMRQHRPTNPGGMTMCRRERRKRMGRGARQMR